jgi:hypothetical protein
MSTFPFSRRHFLKAASLALPLSAVSATELTAAPMARAGGSPGAKQGYWDKKTRLAISMWDFSWLYAGHPGGAYEDLERRVAEAKDRGYNTLRVDCFPSRVLEAESRFEKNWEPGADLPIWGQRPVTFTCNVRRKVAQLAEYCRKHGLWLGLDSWDKGHMFTGLPGDRGGDPKPFAESDEERQFTRYAQTWVKALKLLREDGVLERAVWIAPMNEVPHFAGGHLAALAQLRVQPKHEGETQLSKNQQEDAVYRRINHWMGEAIKAEVAREKIPLSYSSLGAENYAARLTDIYDVVDIHFMPDVILDAQEQKAMTAARHGVTSFHFAEMAKFDLKAFSTVWDAACRKHYQAMLNRARNYHQSALGRLTLPSGKTLDAIITEAFGPCFWPDHPLVSWDWYKHYNGDALRVVATMDFKGSSLSNYAEPLFTLWQDSAWHWTGNAFFLSAGVSSAGAGKR